MKTFTTASILALVATSIGSPAERRQSKRGLAPVDVPTSTDVQNAILDWNTDVEIVNGFLDSAMGLLDDLPSLTTAAQSAANFAADEPNQLKTLKNWFNGDSNNPHAAPDAFICATNDLDPGVQQVSGLFSFQTLVLDVFQNIITDAQQRSAQEVQNQLDVVNTYRCCNVLPDLDIIWGDSASSANLVTQTPSIQGVSTSPARPNTCIPIMCSGVLGASNCSTENNDFSAA
jgi:hypothetical protein